MINKNFEVHVYNKNGAHQTEFFTVKEIAESYARAAFLKANVYKVKIWDLKFPIIPNDPNAEGLILELV